MKKIFSVIKAWFSRFQKCYRYKLTKNVPDRLDPLTLYLETNLEQPWQLVMLCPCGCKSVLHMNLLDEYYPHWKYYLDENDRFTLQPSVNRTVGCRSHFFIKKGEILWCK